MRKTISIHKVAKHLPNNRTTEQSNKASSRYKVRLISLHPEKYMADDNITHT